MTAGAGGILLAQRYQLAADLCRGMRVLDLTHAPTGARAPLEATATVTCADCEVALALAGVDDEIVAELRRRAAAGARVLAAFERDAARSTSPRVKPGAEDAARAFADGLPNCRLLPQFFAEGALIGSSDDDAAPELELSGTEAREEDAAALIVASGFDDKALTHARARLRLTAAPVLLSYVRGLEVAHEELRRANRQLMREGTGRSGSAAASLLNAQRELDRMKAIARGHEEHVKRVEAWYDAPRYHLVDRVRSTVTKLPGLPGLIRFLWSLISTRAESPQLDAAANPHIEDETAEAARAAREREGEPPEEKEPAEVSSRLEG